MIGLILVGILLLVFIVGFVFIKTSPQFGGKANEEQMKRALGIGISQRLAL